MNNNTKRIIIISVVVTIIFFIFDYFNIPSLFWDMNNFNENLWMIVLVPWVTIIVAIVTYKVETEPSLKTLNNRKEVALFFLEKMCSKCNEYILIFDKKYFRNILLSKINYNAIGDSVAYKYLNSPFVDESYFFEFAKNGDVDVETIKLYFNIKELYQEHIYYKILLAGQDATQIEEINDRIIIVEQELKTLINKVIKSQKLI